MSETTPQASPTTDAPSTPLPTPIRWLLVLPAAIGGALAMTIGSVIIVLFSGLVDDIEDAGTVGAVILVFAMLSVPMASINIGAGQAPGHKEKVAMVLAAMWAIGLTAILIYMAAVGGVSGVGDWVLLIACSVAGVIGVVWGFYYARTEGEAAS